MVKAGKLKGGNKGKLKRWRKGQSSSSNPDVKKYREKARSKFFHLHPTSKSNTGLTLEALKIHDEMQDSHLSPSVDDDGSEGGQTFGTFLSGLSDCSNITFKKIQRYWQNNSAKHKEVCAVIAAITEVIRQQGGEESDTAYFAALVTALDSVENVESVTAVSYLLSMTCKRVPQPVLRAKFSEVSKLLVETLERFSNISSESPTALVRSLLICLATVLRNQTVETWSHLSTINVYQTLLSYSFHSKPKIRKAAQNGVCAVLKASCFMLTEEPPKVHPAASTTAKYCVQFIEKSGSTSSDASSSVCHAVSLLSGILHCFPSASLKQSCETILKLMMLSQPIVKSVCLQAFHTMFKNRPKPEFLSAEMNAQLMTALYDYLPSANDIQLLQAWLAVMEESVKNMSFIYQTLTEKKTQVGQLALAHIAKLCKTCLKIMESGIRHSSRSAASTVVAVLEILHSYGSCEEVSTMFKANVKDIFKLLEDGLRYKYHSVWDLIFEIFHAAYKFLAKPENFKVVCNSITSMADLRNTPLFPHKVLLDKALGAATVAIGPRLLLEAVPLMIDGTETDYNFPRSWLLPLLRDHVKNTEIGFFNSYFLPLAAKIRVKAIQLKTSSQQSLAAPYDTLQYQIWLLLPNFCDGATDVPAAFSTLARTIGSAITEREDLRPIAMQALRTLITKCTAENDRKTISRFAKNYLPILFNLYTTLPSTDDVEMEDDNEKESDVDLNKKKSPDRLAALETIRLYLPLADKKMISGYFSKAQKRVFNAIDENDATRLSLLDLLIAMAMYTDVDTLNNVYQDMKPMLNSFNRSMQKKAYRLLEEVCGSNTDDCRTFVDNKLNEIKELLTNGLTAASPSSKGPRLKCMEKILKLLAGNEKYSSEECIEFMRDLIPEVIMCTREKKRARVAAFNILVTAGEVYMEIATRLSDEDNKVELQRKALAEYFQICFAGLGGSPVTVTASICALSRLIYEFKDKMSSELLNNCITNVCFLLGTNTREVCKAALGFVTVLITILDRSTLAQHLKDILGALFEWKSETRRHFRFRVKKMLERLVKKFGYEMINSLVPPDHRKQLANLKKTKERLKRQQKERNEKTTTADNEDVTFKSKKAEGIEELLADSDSDDDDVSEKTKKKNSNSSAWLKDSQDEPMNLLDQSVSQKIIATNPHGSTKNKVEAFKSTPDGRLIIGEDDEDNKEDIEEVYSNLGIKKALNKESMISPSRKRKVTFAEDNDDDSDQEQASYKPGGKGIHRNMGNVYKAKKAKGDIKQKGMHDPYTYIPLNKSVLNKRKRKKMQGQFDGLVRAAKHGATRGRKTRLKKK
ncbi:RRP12-like protein [Styela clava]